MDKVVILFDKDGAGESGYTETLTFRSKGYEDKIEVFKYARQYPDPEPNEDFFVEDYFSPTSYVGKHNIVGFNLNGQPPYHAMKKMAHQSSTIKKYLGNNYQQIDKADYVGFLPLLREIINKLGL